MTSHKYQNYLESVGGVETEGKGLTSSAVFAL